MPFKQIFKTALVILVARWGFLVTQHWIFKPGQFWVVTALSVKLNNRANGKTTVWPPSWKEQWEETFPLRKEFRLAVAPPWHRYCSWAAFFPCKKSKGSGEKKRIGRSSLQIAVLQLTTFRSSAPRIHSVLPFLHLEVLPLLSSCFTLQKQANNSLYKSSYRGGIFPAVCQRLKILTCALTSHFMQQAELLK